MKKLNIILLLTLSTLLLACESPTQTSASTELAPVSESKIYLFGDDLAAGNGATTSFAEIIADTENLELVDLTYSGSNATVNNTLSVQSLDQVDSNDIVIINVGYQDARWYGTNYPYASHNSLFIDPFLQAAKNKTSNVYVIGPVKMKASSYALYSPSDSGSDQAMIDFESNLQTRAGLVGATYISIISFNPIVSNLDVNEEFPNDQGHSEIATIIYNQVGF